MTITKLNNCEGGSNGTTVSTGNSGGASGDAWALLSFPSGAIIADTASASHGSLGMKFTPASGQQCIARWAGFSDTTGVMRRYITIDTLPASGTEVILSANSSTGGSVISVAVNSAGKYAVLDSTGTTIGTVTTNSHTAGDRVELSWTVGTTSSNGAYNFALYRGDSTTATETKSGTTQNLSNSGAITLWDRATFGKTSTSTWVGVTRGDDFAAASGTTTFFGVPASPPTAAFTSSAVALAASFDGTGSTAAGSATITGYSWDFGDSTSGTGSAPSHTYSSGGTYTVVLTVTDSNANTNSVSHAVTVAAAAGTASVQSVTVSTGWTPSAGTVLSAVTDGDPTTFDTSSAGPTGQELDVVLGALVPPAAGQPLKVFIQMDALSAVSASLNAQLYEGATSRATLTGIAIPSGAGATVTGLVTLTFPWSSVSVISTGGWSALTVKLQITAA